MKNALKNILEEFLIAEIDTFHLDQQFNLAIPDFFFV